jgi:hypothetical protein
VTAIIVYILLHLGHNIDFTYSKINSCPKLDLIFNSKSAKKEQSDVIYQKKARTENVVTKFIEIQSVNT